MTLNNITITGLIIGLSYSSSFCLESGQRIKPLVGERTLLNSPLNSHLLVLHRLSTTANTLGSTFPMSCDDKLIICPVAKGYNYFENGDSLTFTPQFGLEHREFYDKSVYATELGLLAEGVISPFRYYLDARIYSEQQDAILPSYDGSFVERQDESSGKSGATFSSYARFQGSIYTHIENWQLAFSRGLIHWGPTYFYPLTLGRYSTPFYSVSLTRQFKNFIITTVYAPLTIDGDGELAWISKSRSLYAHRYQWMPTTWLEFGLSETLVLYEDEQPWAFVPVFPLFMAKGEGLEHNNNGNISGDIQIKYPGLFRIYSEFLIDDMQDPSSIFNDYWGNRWAVTLGLHLVKDIGNFKNGIISEFSRVEPWVYTHYEINSAQAANRGYSLGHPFGPDNFSMSTKLYSKIDDFYFSIDYLATQKGKQLGSNLNDEAFIEFEFIPKTWLKNADAIYHQIQLEAAFDFNLYFDFKIDTGLTFELSEKRPAWLERSLIKPLTWFRISANL